jgi:membrane protein implicated in regulation of membrane protease activity
LIESALELLNPMVLSVFMTYFGLTGLFLHFSAPSLGITSLVPAIFVGFIATRILSFVVQWMALNMEVSSAAVVEDLVGTIADVIVPISAGRLGQICYVIQSKRYTAPAKAFGSETEIGKGDKVMIAEIRDHVMYVEPWTDPFPAE